MMTSQDGVAPIIDIWRRAINDGKGMVLAINQYPLHMLRQKLRSAAPPPKFLTPLNGNGGRDCTSNHPKTLQTRAISCLLTCRSAIPFRDTFCEASVEQNA